MDYKMSLYELGKFLEAIDSRYDISLLSRIKLSGGWMTIIGDVSIDYIPNKEGLIGGNNIISLKLSNGNEEGNTIKITGLKDLLFSVNLAAAKYKSINKCGLNIDQVKEKKDKCTLRIDEDMIFTINAPMESIAELL